MVVRTTVGPKGQVTIPKDLRERFHLLEGEDVMVLASNDGVLIKHPPSSLRGRLKGKISIQTFEEEIKQVRRQWRF